MANSTLSLQVAVDTNAANTDIDAILKRLKALEDQSNRTSSAQTHGVTSTQAASAAIRTLEGNLTNNVRAGERFLATIPGISDALKTAFPVVGAASLAGVLFEMGERAQNVYQWFQKAGETPQRILQGLEPINQALRLTNDQLAVSNDKLESEIAKLQGKPQNGLKLALDEARQASDKLAESLEKTFADVTKTLKDQQIGAFKGFFTGQQSTTDIVQQWQTFNDNLLKISVDTDNKIDAETDPKKKAKIYSDATDVRIAAMIKERDTLKKALDPLLTQQQAYDDIQKRMNASQTDDTRQNAPTPEEIAGVSDHQGAINALSTSLSIVRREIENAQGEIQAGTDEGLKARLDSEKQFIDARKALESESAKALRSSIEKEYGGIAGIAEKYAGLLDDARKKSGMTPAAFAASSIAQNLEGAMRNDMLEASKRDILEYRKEQDKQVQLDAENSAKSLNDQLSYRDQVAQATWDVTQKGLSFQEQALDKSRDMQLKQLDSLDAKTVQQKLSVEEQKLAIEQSFLQKSLALQVSNINNVTDRELAAASDRHDQALRTALSDADRQKINAAYDAERAGIAVGSAQAITAAQMNAGDKWQDVQSEAAKAQTQVLQDEYKSAYDNILKFTDNFLDTVEDHTTGAWKRMGQNLEKTFEKAINDFLSSQIAGTFASLLTGLDPNGETGKAGGKAMGRPGGFAGAGLGVAQQFTGGLGGTAPFVGSGGWSNAYNDRSGGSGLPMIALPPALVANASNLDPQTAAVLAEAAAAGATDHDMARILTTNGYDPRAVGYSFPTGGGSVIAASSSGMDLSQFRVGGIGPGGTAGTFAGSIGQGGGYYGTASTSGARSPLGGLSNPAAIFKQLQNGGWRDLASTGATMAGASMLMSGATNPALAGTAKGSAKTIGGAAMLGYGQSQNLADLADTIGVTGRTDGLPGGNALGGTLIGVGAGMVINGSERGSWGGTAESTAGGALAGWEIAGPIGAAIGAGVGFVSGVVGMVVGNATDHVRSVVRRSFGLSIDTATAQAILKIAQEQYGGNVSIAVSGPEVRKLLQTWVQMHTGGNGYALNPTATGYTVSQSGGALTNQMANIDGSAAGSFGGLVPSVAGGQSMQSFSGGYAGNGSMTIQLSGPATTSLLSGIATSVAPQANMAAMAASQTRQQTAVQLLSPGTVTGYGR